MTSRRLAAGLVLCLVGAALSAVLLFEHHGEGQSLVDRLCGEGPASGCETVARSPQAKIAGIPWAALGLFFYLSIAVLLGLALATPEAPRDAAAGLTLAAVVAALVVDLALLGVQTFTVKAFCALCLVTYAVNVALLAALWPARTALGAVRGALAGASGRLLASAWVIASLAFGAAVFAAELALASRSAAREARLLGAPVPPSAPSGDSEAARLQDEVRRLKETLDDPQKLDQYFAEKAAREYEAAPVQRVDLQEVPTKGATGAPVKVVEFSDFLCPYCRSVAGAFAAFVPQSGSRVQLFFKNYPLDQACNPSLKATTHPGACLLALGGICAQYQGRFWPYHDRVFSTELKNPQAADVVRIAAAAGLNASALDSCMEDPRTRQHLSGEIAEAQRLGVQVTPTLFVNGKKLPRINDFVQVVDKEAQAKGFPPLAAAQGK